MDDSYLIRRIYLDERLVNTSIHNRIKSRISSDVSMEVVRDMSSFIKDFRYRESKRFMKDTLVVQHYSGEFLSLCPGTNGMVCCNYFVINTGPGCVYDCHYCFLQSFMNTPFLSVYGNTDDMLQELDRKLHGKRGNFRVGTGEYSDSLAVEELLGINSILVERISEMENVRLELKTKSDHIDSLLSLNHGGHSVVAWSLNPQKVIEEIEEGTASLEKRLQAALKVIEAGYETAFHFDPMIYYDGWKEDYKYVVDRLFDTIPSQKIAWISIGSFRYSPGLMEIIQQRFPNDRLTAPEMIQGSDGKYRYFKTIREEMYRSLRGFIHERDSSVFTYFCMETRNMWNRIYQQAPDSPAMLEKGFHCSGCSS